MIINFMSWNTRLFESGREELFDAIIEKIQKHLEKPKSIAVLQEIPFYCKHNNKWMKHKLFEKFEKIFQDYTVLHENKYALKITVVIAKNDLICKDEEGIKNKNIYVSFKVKETDLRILGVHSHDAFELREELCGSFNYHPNIILGDFNSGNYIKNDKEKDAGIAVNRQNYLMLTEGYIDIFQGQYTTNYNPPTQIDHVLLENSYEFALKHKYSNAIIDRDIDNLSDHYPLMFELGIG